MFSSTRWIYVVELSSSDFSQWFSESCCIHQSWWFSKACWLSLTIYCSTVILASLISASSYCRCQLRNCSDITPRFWASLAIDCCIAFSRYSVSCCYQGGWIASHFNLIVNCDAVHEDKILNFASKSFDWKWIEVISALNKLREKDFQYGSRRSSSDSGIPIARVAELKGNGIWPELS